MNAEARSPARFGPWRREVASFLELFALTGIAIAQPTFDVIGKNASELVANGRTRPQIIAMTILVLFVPAIVAWGVEVLVGIAAPTLRRLAHATIAAIIVGTIAVEALKHQLGWGAAALLVAGIILGVGGGLLLLRSDTAHTFLRYLAGRADRVAILFIFFSPVSTLLFPGDADAAQVKIGTPSCVVMVVMDELPEESLLNGAGGVDATLFPNFAALARGSTWYRNHTTVSPYTETAVPAILDGDLPPPDTYLPVASEYPNNLFTLLGGRYQMNVHETVTHLCPNDLCGAPAQERAQSGFLGFLADTTEIWTDFASPTQPLTREVAKEFSLTEIGRAQRAGGPFLRSLKPGHQPRLDFLHVVLPHQGWHYVVTGQDNHGSFESSQVIDAAGKPVWPNPWVAKVGRQRHLLQLQYADQVLGRVMSKLKRINAYDDSLIVVTADHGVAFDATEPVRGVSAENYPQIMWTPLFIKTPGQGTGAVSDQPVRSIDVLPTIADLLDVKLPWKTDGRSILGPPRKEGPLPILEWGQSTLTPPGDERFSEVSGADGFAAVMKGQATSALGDPTLRLYRLGPYGDLVGTAAAPITGTPSRDATASVTNLNKFRAVNLSGRFIPWQWIDGAVEGVPIGASVAISVNGVVAGISEVVRDADGATTFWSSLPPTLLVNGRNDITVSLINGGPDAPRLTPLPLRP